MKNNKTVLVCVTPQESSEVLLKAGKAIADENGAELEIVSVLPFEEGEYRVDPQVLEKLYQTAQKEGGEMALYFSDDPILTVTAHTAKRKPITLVVGFPGENSNNFISTIHLLIPDIPISMIDKDSKVYNILPCEAVQGVR
ncbi:MAG: hypothetical protein ACI4VI_06115 [Acutalibacteraceae bacterium]|nr:hypothetical protein [Oscillospiraceae bacterium]